MAGLGTRIPAICFASTQYLVLNNVKSDACEMICKHGVDRLLNFQLLGATTEAIQTGKMKGKNLHVFYESSLTKVEKYRQLRDKEDIHQKLSDFKLRKRGECDVLVCHQRSYLLFVKMFCVPPAILYVGHSGDQNGLFLGVLADTVPKTHSNWI